MARTARTKRPQFSATCSQSSRVFLKPNGSSDTDLDPYSSDSDSSEESVTVENQGVVDDSGVPVVRAYQVVEAKPVVTVKEENLSDLSEEEEEPSALIVKWQVKARIAEGKALVGILEQELLSGLSGALTHKKDPFRKLRTAFGVTDLDFCYGADQELDYRIDRIRALKKIAQDYERLGTCRLWRAISFPIEEE